MTDMILRYRLRNLMREPRDYCAEDIMRSSRSVPSPEVFQSTRLIEFAATTLDPATLNLPNLLQLYSQ